MAILKTVPQIATELQSAYGAEWGGYIQDATTKVVGKHYTDKINKKGYVCIKVGSNVNSSEFYEECNVFFNEQKNKIREYVYGTAPNRVVRFVRSGNVVTVTLDSYKGGFALDEKVAIPVGFRPHLNGV
ncbi:MAG: hypothetical protein ACRC6E_01700 [Fusobacteriaceae bacterium]